MKTVVVLGCGAMGQAAVFAAARNPRFDRVLAVDRVEARLPAPAAHPPGVERLFADVGSAEVIDALASADVCAAALPWEDTWTAIRAAVTARCPLVSITRPDYADIPALTGELRAASVPLLLPLGLEPGLTEILACAAVERLDRVESLRIRCGGIPAHPRGPLFYALAFGTRLPLTCRAAYAVHDGTLVTTTRFAGLERLTVPGVGRLEAHHDGMLPWFPLDPSIARIREVSQKTLRWPGFTERVLLLHELGLLADEPVAFGGSRVVPRDFVEYVLAPRVRRAAEDRDVVVLRVEADGEDRRGKTRRERLQCVERYEPSSGLTAMARLTGFTLAAAASLLAEGTIEGSGWLFPHRVVRGKVWERLRQELERGGIGIKATSTAVRSGQARRRATTPAG
jgi:lysine 6-dehydrogenase